MWSSTTGFLFILLIYKWIKWSYTKFKLSPSLSLCQFLNHLEKNHTICSRTHLNFYLYKPSYFWEWPRVMECEIRYHGPKAGCTLKIGACIFLWSCYCSEQEKRYFLKLTIKIVHISLYLWKQELQRRNKYLPPKKKKKKTYNEGSQQDFKYCKNKVQVMHAFFP